MENKSTYIHETHTLYAENGELYLLYDDGDYDKQLVFNVETLYNDLPSIIRLCVEQKKISDKNTLERLKSTIQEL
jgi:hypothetical protein